MKRLTREMKERLIRKARWAEVKRRRREGFGRIYGESIRGRQPRSAAAAALASLPELTVSLKGALRLQTDPVRTLKQLSQLDDAISQRSKFSRFRVVMDEVTELDAAGLLYMCSRLSELWSYGAQVSGTWPKNERTVKTLFDGGFTGFLKGKKPEYDSSTKTLQLYQGTARQRLNPSLAPDVRLFLKGLNPKLGVEEIDHINLAVIECIENVRLHAYSRRRNSASSKKWFMVGIHDEEAHLSTVAILDLGVGVRSTVQRRLSKVTKTIEWAVLPTHGLIKEATLGLRTETGERHRGKGLRTLRDFSVRFPGRHLRVLSGDGMVSWSGDGVKETAEEISLPRCKGTIVCLEISTA
jgi:hypothetical protein